MKELNKDTADRFNKEILDHTNNCDLYLVPNILNTNQYTLIRYKTHQIKSFLAQEIELAEKRARTELLEKIDDIRFDMNVDEYTTLIDNWNKKNFDIPFAHGYAQAKKDIKDSLIHES